MKISFFLQEMLKLLRVLLLLASMAMNEIKLGLFRKTDRQVLGRYVPKIDRMLEENDHSFFAMETPLILILQNSKN